MLQAIIVVVRIRVNEINEIPNLWPATESSSSFLDLFFFSRSCSPKPLFPIWHDGRLLTSKSTTVSHFCLPHGSVRLKMGESMVVEDSLRNRAFAGSCYPKHLFPLWRAGRFLTSKSTTISQFRLSHGGLHLLHAITVVMRIRINENNKMPDLSITST